MRWYVTALPRCHSSVPGVTAGTPFGVTCVKHSRFTRGSNGDGSAGLLVMRTMQRTLAVIPLALALAWPAASRGQAPVMVVPGPAILLGPLLLFTITLAIQLSRSDQTRVRELEARSDWDGLVRLATQRLARDPHDPHWLELRGGALQRQGRCAEAIPDLQAAFDGHIERGSPVDNLLSPGLALGVCQLAVPGPAAAAATFERLRQLAPMQPEPVYHLGVVRTMQGDAAGADDALATLASLSSPLAESLQTYRRAYAGTALGPPAAAAPAAEPARPIPAGRLEIGDRVLQLPDASWYFAGRSESTVRGGQMRTTTIGSSIVPLVTLRAYALTAGAGLRAAAEFTANPQQSYGTAYWNADDGCAVPQVLHLHRFRVTFDQSECVYVRMFNAQADSRWSFVSQVAGLAAPELAYEVHYERFGIGWAVGATWLLPVHQVAGDMAAVQWAHAMAAQLRPLANAAHPAPALIPALVQPDQDSSRLPVSRPFMRQPRLLPQLVHAAPLAQAPVHQHAEEPGHEEDRQERGGQHAAHDPGAN